MGGGEGKSTETLKMKGGGKKREKGGFGGTMQSEKKRGEGRIDWGFSEKKKVFRREGGRDGANWR